MILLSLRGIVTPKAIPNGNYFLELLYFNQREGATLTADNHLRYISVSKQEKIQNV